MRTSPVERIGSGAHQAMRCPFSRVLLPLDGTEDAERAIGPAIALARAAGALVWPVSVAGAAAADARLDHLEDVAAGLGVKYVQPDVMGGDRAGEAVSDLASSHNRLHGGLVICMSSRARHTIPEVVLGSTAKEVVHSAGCPVLLVGPHEPSVAWEPRSLVVCLDGSRLSEAILPTAVAWTKAFGMALWLVESIHPDMASPEDSDESAYLKHQARGIRAHGVDAQWDVLHERDAAAGIAEFASTLPGGMVAMTTHGRSGLRLVTMGSVATAILRHSTAPVLVSRPSIMHPDAMALGSW